MNPVKLREYSSARFFRIYDLVENYLLIRGEGGMFIGTDIDLIFLGVKYIEIPFELEEIKITKPRDTQSIEYEQKFAPDKFAKPGDRAYLIESTTGKFHIIASNFWIHVSTEHRSESSLPHILNDDETKRNLYFDEYVAEWYKIE